MIGSASARICAQPFTNMSKKTPLPNRSQAPAAGAAMQVQTVSHSFEGPIPPPAILQQYDAAIPGAAERILRLAEQETQHRHNQENSATQANISAQRKQLDIADYQSRAVFKSDTTGQALGFIVSMACVAGSVYLAVNGQPWVAGALAGLPLAGIIRALRERPRQQK